MRPADTCCDRFKKQLGYRIIENSPFQKGDLSRVVGINIRQSGDCLKLHITFHNDRTEEEYTLAMTSDLYNHKDEDEDKVNRLHDYLFPDPESEDDNGEFLPHRKEAVELLQKAELISPNFKAEPEVT